MSGGKIDPLIVAATNKMAATVRSEITAAMDVIMRAVAQEIIPLQQDVERLNERVRNLEREREPPPTISDGQTEQKHTK